MKKIKQRLKKISIVVFIKKILDNILLFIKAFIAKIFLIIHPLNVNVMSIDDTLNEIITDHKSVIRFGDGEFNYLSGNSLPFQKYDQRLANYFRKIIENRDKNLLICMPEPIMSTKNLVFKSRLFWTYRKFKDYKNYKALESDYTYGNAFISRPYIVYKDKSNAKVHFELLKKIWENKKVLIVEGKYSRSGVGNDLFSNARKVGRIICPAENAFDFFEEIKKEILNNSKYWDLILIALGPTSKPLVFELLGQNVWSIDIGHIDSEYEWFLAGAKKKIKITSKHTAESNDLNIPECNDKEYLKSIIYRIGE